jgi:hypothetical protein
MNGLVIGLMVLVVAGCSGLPDRDKTGTTGRQIPGGGSQTLKSKEPAQAGSLVAERAGFSDRRLGSHPIEQQLFGS